MTRRLNQDTQERVVLTYDHAEVADADLTVKLFRAPRECVIEKVDYINPTGLATHADNHFNIKILNEALVAANWNTDTGADETIAADTWVTLNLSATAANKHLVAGEVLSLFLDESGTQTLPAGRVVIHLRYL